MARITRNKAAEILGLSRQTISNYIEQGLIGSCVGEHGILYVNSEDVEKYAQKYKMLAANEKMIDDKLKEVEAHKRAINVELTELRNRATANGKLAANAVGMLFGVINTMSYLNITPKLSYRESQMLKDIINGMTYDELSFKYDLTAARIRQIVDKTCNKLTYNEDATIATNQDLRIVIENLKKKLKAVQTSYDEYRRAKGDVPISGVILSPLILGKDVNDCNFPVRILNMFRGYNVYTVGDLLRKFHGKSDIAKIRNLGKKSIYIILDFIEENNLSFKQYGESDEDFYIRLNNLMNKKHEEND
jgi:predicted transcriptional regulator